MSNCGVSLAARAFSSAATAVRISVASIAVLCCAHVVVVVVVVVVAVVVVVEVVEVVEVPFDAVKIFCLLQRVSSAFTTKSG